MSKTDWEKVVLNGVELEIDFTYTAPCKGMKDVYGQPVTPDEPAIIEIEAIKTVSGDNIGELLSEEQYRAIEALIIQQRGE
jgi:hypothetical protein